MIGRAKKRALQVVGWAMIAAGLILSYKLATDAGVTLWLFLGTGVVLFAAVMIVGAFMATAEARRRPIDPGTRPAYPPARQIERGWSAPETYSRLPDGAAYAIVRRMPDGAVVIRPTQ